MDFLVPIYGNGKKEEGIRASGELLVSEKGGVDYQSLFEMDENEEQKADTVERCHLYVSLCAAFR